MPKYPKCGEDGRMRFGVGRFYLIVEEMRKFVERRRDVSYALIEANFCLGGSTIKQAFDALAEEGIICQKGNRWKYVQKGFVETEPANMSLIPEVPDASDMNQPEPFVSARTLAKLEKLEQFRLIVGEEGSTQELLRDIMDDVRFAEGVRQYTKRLGLKNDRF